MADRLQSGDDDLTSTTGRCNRHHPVVVAQSLEVAHHRCLPVAPHDPWQSTLPNREVTTASARRLMVLKTVAPHGCGPQDCGSSRLW